MFATRPSTTSLNPFDSFIYDDDMEDLYCSNSSGSTASLSGSVESLSSQPFDPSSPNFLDTSPPLDDYLPLTTSPSDLLFKHITPTHPSEDWQVAFSCSGGDSDMMMLGLAGESYWNGDFSTFARDDHTSFVSYDRAQNSGNRMVVEEEVTQDGYLTIQPTRRHYFNINNDCYAPWWFREIQKVSGATDIEGACRFCSNEDGSTLWLGTANGAYRQHLLAEHGVSEQNRLPFLPPLSAEASIFMAPGLTTVAGLNYSDALCLYCGEKVLLGVSRESSYDCKLEPETRFDGYFKHAAACHPDHRTALRDLGSLVARRSERDFHLELLSQLEELLESGDVAVSYTLLRPQVARPVSAMPSTPRPRPYDRPVYRSKTPSPTQKAKHTPTTTPTTKSTSKSTTTTTTTTKSTSKSTTTTTPTTKSTSKSTTTLTPTPKSTTSSKSTPTTTTATPQSSPSTHPPNTTSHLFKINPVGTHLSPPCPKKD